MNDHLTPEEFTALASGELPAGDLNSIREHMNRCLACANLAMDEWLLKTAVGKSGHRYDVPAAFRDRMSALIVKEGAKLPISGANAAPPSRVAAWPRFAGWTAAALLVLALGGWSVLEYRNRGVYPIRAESAAEVTETCDLHIAMLAADQPPQVVSSDRHTVKPWFQGKLPFTFNIPEAMPPGATLDGANLAYLHNRPVAQLLFHIDRHRVSVFVQEKENAVSRGQFAESHAGFQVVGVETDDLELIAVSDVEAGRLAALANGIRSAQAHH